MHPNSPPSPHRLSLHVEIEGRDFPIRRENQEEMLKEKERQKFHKSRKKWIEAEISRGERWSFIMAPLVLSTHALGCCINEPVPMSILFFICTARNLYKK